MISGVIVKLSIFIMLMMMKSTCQALYTDSFIMYECVSGKQSVRKPMGKETGMAKRAQLSQHEAGHGGVGGGE